MKVQIAWFSLAALVAVMPEQSVAADWNSGAGSIKDMSGSAAVPVPAPVPIPDYKPSWYFRMDAGYGVMSEPTISEHGFQYGGLINGENANGKLGASKPALLSNDPSWLSTDFNDMATFGAGVGYYIGGGWRADATVEGRSNNQIEINGKDSWTSFGYRDTDNNPLTADVLTSDLDGDGKPNDRTTHIVLKDKTSVTGTVWMANLYYDLMTGQRFNPYVGAGFGFVWNDLERKHTTTVTSQDNLKPDCGCTNEYSKSTTARSESVSLAAAAMAGVTYQLSDITSIDVGYRALYLGGADFNSTIDGYSSHISGGDQFLHEVRAGLRFDVN